MPSTMPSSTSAGTHTVAHPQPDFCLSVHSSIICFVLPWTGYCVQQVSSRATTLVSDYQPPSALVGRLWNMGRAPPSVRRRAARTNLRPLRPKILPRHSYTGRSPHWGRRRAAPSAPAFRPWIDRLATSRWRAVTASASERSAVGQLGRVAAANILGQPSEHVCTPSRSQSSA
jgi:hypothetical protein